MQLYDGQENPYSKNLRRDAHFIPLYKSKKYDESYFMLQTISYMAEDVVGTGSFGVVFQVLYLAL